jgi:ACT domain-containing protein
MDQTRIVVTVLGADRSGIVAAVATRLSEGGANIVDISQTIIGGIFTMTMLVDLDEAQTSFDALRESLVSLENQLGVQIQVQREDVFRFMHRI